MNFSNPITPKPRPGRMGSISTSILAALLAGCGGGGGNGAPALAAPTLADAADQTYVAGSAITDLVFANSGGGSLTGCSVEPDLPAGLSVERTSNDNTCRLTGTPTAITAQATYTVTATNATNSDSASVSVTVNPPAPSLADAEAQTYVRDVTIDDLVFDNGGGGLLTNCSVDPALPAGLEIERTSDKSTCRLTGTPTAVAVETAYTVTATNATESDDATVTITVNPPAPSLADAETQTYITGTAINDLVFVNGGGGSLIGCTVDPRLPAGLTAEPTSDKSTCQITGTPTAVAVETAYTVTATNATESDNASITITVNPPAPSLVDVDVQIYVMGEKITNLVFTNDGGGLLTGCTVDPGLPAGLDLNPSSDNATCVLSGSPSALAAKKDYTVTAANITGNDSTTVAITVNLFSLSLTEDQTHIYPVGQSVSIAFTNNGGGSLIGCTVDPRLPAGLTLEPTSGDGSCVLTGTALLPSAQATYTITATDSMGSGAVAFPITIANVFLPDTVAVIATTAQLSWTALETATGYEVWRAEVGDGEQITRVRANTAETTYTDSAITANTDYYYLIAECTALGCVDPSNTGPVPIASVTDDGTTELDGARGITTTTSGDSSFALVTAIVDDGIQIIDISDPANPMPIASLSDDDTTELDGAKGIATTTFGGKTYALVAASTDDNNQMNEGIQIIDITDPINPMAVGSLTDTPQTELKGAIGVATIKDGGDTYALVTAFDDDRMQIIDISNPATPVASGFLDKDDQSELDLDGVVDITTTVIGGKPYALVTALLDNGMQIIDISDPSDPEAAGSLTDGTGRLKLGFATGITATTISGKTYALVTSPNDNGVQIIDISDPSEPRAAGSLDDTDETELDNASGITTTTIGGRTYALVTAFEDDGVQIIDVTTPQQVIPATTDP